MFITHSHSLLKIGWFSRAPFLYGSCTFQAAWILGPYISAALSQLLQREKGLDHWALVCKCFYPKVTPIISAHILLVKLKCMVLTTKKWEMQSTHGLRSREELDVVNISNMGHNKFPINKSTVLFLLFRNIQERKESIWREKGEGKIPSSTNAQ